MQPFSTAAPTSFPFGPRCASAASRGWGQMRSERKAFHFPCPAGRWDAPPSPILLPLSKCHWPFDGVSEAGRHSGNVNEGGQQPWGGWWGWGAEQSEISLLFSCHCVVALRCYFKGPVVTSWIYWHRWILGMGVATVTWFPGAWLDHQPANPTYSSPNKLTTGPRAECRTREIKSLLTMPFPATRGRQILLTGPIKNAFYATNTSCCEMFSSLPQRLFLSVTLLVSLVLVSALHWNERKLEYRHGHGAVCITNCSNAFFFSSSDVYVCHCHRICDCFTLFQRKQKRTLFFSYLLFLAVSNASRVDKHPWEMFGGVENLYLKPYSL